MKKINKKWFSMIEILVWIVIFLFWITWVYTIIHSTLFLNDYNKNYIIWVNLAREQLELFRNVRDSNFKNTRNYLVYKINDVNDSSKDDRFDKDFTSWKKTYKISNDFTSSAPTTVKVEKEEAPSSYIPSELEKFQICLDKDNLYDYCSNISWDKKELRIYKFITIEKVTNDPNLLETDLEKAVKVKSKVIWYSKRFSEFEVEEIFTNYKIY